MPSVSVPNINASRARSYLFRLPLFTRVAIAAIVAAWVVPAVIRWDVQGWGALVPAEVGFSSLYRTNTYPFIHTGFFHMLMNVLALMPLLERFESEYGTLTALALFMGPFSTFPAFLYIFIQTFILHQTTTAVSGASIWVFLLLAVEAMRTHRTNPYFAIGPYNIPTWTTPLISAAVISALVPNASLLGHLCALAVGYVCGLGYMKWLSPPEKALRWVEGRLNLLGRLPRYVSVDAKTYGRFGVLPSAGGAGGPGTVPGVQLGVVGSTQRLGP